MNTPFALDIKTIFTGKNSFLDLLLIGDESLHMISRYLDKSTLFAGYIDSTPVAVCAVTPAGSRLVEIKNLAVDPRFRRKGIGRLMIRHVEAAYASCDIILGTGETPSTLRFYRSCGFSYSHRVPRFFADNYPEPIVEEGVTLCDMIYLKKPRRKT